VGSGTGAPGYAQDTASILAFTALSIVPALGCVRFAQRHLAGGFDMGPGASGAV
jgi:raffinose/stachyose/melibiose transport system permease protein